VKTISKQCQDKMVKEFEYMRGHASPALRKFMDYITYEHMIDNVLLLLKSNTGGGGGRSLEDIVASCHPLGMFDPKGRLMKTITMFDNTPEGYADLYADVLSDTPIGPYFEQLLWEFMPPHEGATGDSLAGQSAREAMAVFKETPTTVLEHNLRKYWLEDFLGYCESLGGATATVMGDLLKTRADITAIHIVMNSFYGSANRDYNQANTKGDRALLMPSIGHLYPVSIDADKGLVNVRNEDELIKRLASHEEGLVGEGQSYHADLLRATQERRDLVDVFFEREVMMNEGAFEGQFHYGVFYAYIRLKEQECRNIAWIGDCITNGKEGRKHIHQHLVPIFSPNSVWRKAATSAAATGH
jgi:V-type H+-transporting ATPase subunit d